MKGVRVPRIVAPLACLLAVSLAPAPARAEAAEVRVGPLVLKADGGFQPQVLPKRKRVPIRFQGWAKIRTTDGTVPPAVRRIKLEFDRDGKLNTAGLPTCASGSIQQTTTQQARNRCKGAIVGTGSVAAVLDLGARIKVRAPLTLFNGPRRGGNITVLAHAQTTIPVPQTYVVEAAIEERRGTFGYRTKFDIPAIAGGVGALTDARVKIGREFRHRGKQRSYVTARCSDSILQTQGLFWFEDGNVISGSIYKGCSQAP